MTTTQDINLDDKITAIQTDLETLAQQTNIVVVDDATEQKAIDFLSAVKSRFSRIEQLRKFFVGPLNDQVKAINNKFKMQLAPLEEMEAQVKKVLTDYMREKERKAYEAAEKARKEREAIEAEEFRKQEEALRKETEAANAALAEKNKKKRAALEAEAEKARLERLASQEVLDQQVTTLVEAPAKSVRANGGLLISKKTWTFEVVDEDLLMQKCPNLFILDTKAVNALIQGGEREIPGLKIFQETSVNLRK